MKVHKKAIEMKIVYIIIALLMLLWAAMFIKSLREFVVDLIRSIFG